MADKKDDKKEAKPQLEWFNPLDDLAGLFGLVEDFEKAATKTDEPKKDEKEKVKDERTERDTKSASPVNVNVNLGEYFKRRKPSEEEGKTPGKQEPSEASGDSGKQD